MGVKVGSRITVPAANASHSFTAAGANATGPMGHWAGYNLPNGALHR